MEVHVWTGAELLERNAAKRHTSRSLLFALAPKATAWTLMAAMLGLSAAPAGAVAKGPPPKAEDPVIKLPPAPGGQQDGQESNAPDGEGTEEDTPEPPPPPPAQPPPPVPAEPPATPTEPPQSPAPTPLQSQQPTAPPVQPPAPPAPPSGPVTPPPIEPAPPPVGEPPPVPQAAPAPQTAPQAENAPRKHRERSDRRSRPTRTPPGSQRAPQSSIAESVIAHPSTTPRAPAARPRMRVSTRQLDRLAGPTHTVGAGETLWSIAERVLGGEASDAQIAALVDRLWAMNANRIGTGDPDQLPVGVTLRLPRSDTGGQP